MQAKTTEPTINVTPLIDVLLVMLIIFMVAAPLKPSRFLSQVPEPPDDRPLETHDHTLLVTINPDHTLMLNSLADMGTVADTAKLSTKLSVLFHERLKNRAFSHRMMARTDVHDWDRVERTVFIKAPRSMHYAHIVRVIDALKGAGANPIGLQIDSLQ